MPTVFIDNRPIDLPVRWHAGDIIEPEFTEVLHRIWLKRIAARLRYLKEKGEDDETIQAKALEFAAQPLGPYSTVQDEEDDDPVIAEALDIARAMIVSRMEAEGLPPPKGLDTHARALVDAMPQLVERARGRVEARYRAASLAMGVV